MNRHGTNRQHRQQMISFYGLIAFTGMMGGIAIIGTLVGIPGTIMFPFDSVAFVCSIAAISITGDLFLQRPPKS